jgi:hypothetical protein
MWDLGSRNKESGNLETLGLGLTVVYTSWVKHTREFVCPVVSIETPG